MKNLPCILLIALMISSCGSEPGNQTFTERLEEAMSSAETGKNGANSPLILIDFGDEFDLENVETIKAEVSLAGEPGDRRLLVKCFPDHRSAGIVLSFPEGSLDLNGYRHVAMEITNRHGNPIQLIIQVGDPDDSFERWQMQEVIDLQPGETITAVDPITVTPWLFSSPLKLVGMFGPPGQVKSDLSNIRKIRISTRFASEPLSFEIGNIRAEGTIAYVDTTGFLPFMDPFGQYKHRNWPGKIHGEEDLSDSRLAEEDDLLNSPGPADWSIYGGWTGGPRFEASGFFRTQKYKGLWWLVDPEGYLFWSNGVNCVHAHSGNTGISGRIAYFEALPEREGSFGEFYEKSRGSSRGFYQEFGPFETYDFTASNMRIKYGDEWEEEFNRLAHSRLRSWGFNTFANASSRDLYLQGKTPYVATVWVRGTLKIDASSGYQGKFHDVFDPGFRKALKSSLSYKKEESKDPWCIGFFIENELSWGRDRSLALATLASPADQPAKIEFIKDLKTKYVSIENLNRSWDTEHESWDVLLQSKEQPDEENALEDLNAFYKKIAVTYFTTVSEEMDAVAPDILYLGCRLAWANSDIVVRTASKYCDVISYNKYEYSVANVGLPAGVDMPIMIGEFHFGALDRGSLHVGIKSAKDQQQRAVFFQKYVESALGNPYIVGTHWFQYMDQAATGRFDGENYNIGLLDICDTPFPEMIEAARETGYSLYETRLSGAQK